MRGVSWHVCPVVTSRLQFLEFTFGRRAFTPVRWNSLCPPHNIPRNASRRGLERTRRSWRELRKLHEFMLRNDGVTGSSPVCGTILLVVRNGLRRSSRYFARQSEPIGQCLQDRAVTWRLQLEKVGPYRTDGSNPSPSAKRHRKTRRGAIALEMDVRSSPARGRGAAKIRTAEPESRDDRLTQLRVSGVPRSPF